MNAQQQKEWLKCAASLLYFVDQYCYIYDATAREWIPFRLWKAQAKTLRTILNNLLVIILKARQLGLTWLVLCFALWLMLFHPAATVLLFSRRDDEAIHLLERLKNVYKRLPEWMRVRAIEKDDAHVWRLSNGSEARAFPTSAGDSYTASLAIVDEADLVPDLGRLMGAVKPTIDGGGRMVLLSRSDKGKPASQFKKIYRAAKKRLTDWVSVFLPWHIRPGRDRVWYEAQKADIISRTGALDDLHEQYPATDAEALAPRTLDKRIPPAWLQNCFEEWEPLLEAPPSLPGLAVYVDPEPGARYVIGADPAEGNPTSDASAASAVNRDTGEQVAKLSGQYEPSTFAAYVDELGRFLNDADVMVERNNHGHAVLLWMRDNSRLRLLTGHDGKDGWLSSTKGKALLYSTAADAFKNEETIVHSLETYLQLASIEGSTLRAPEGERDDEADAHALALAGAARAMKETSRTQSRVVSARELLG